MASSTPDPGLALTEALWLTGAAADLHGFGQMAMGASGTKLVGYGQDLAIAVPWHRHA